MIVSFLNTHKRSLGLASGVLFICFLSGYLTSGFGSLAQRESEFFGNNEMNQGIDLDMGLMVAELGRHQHWGEAPGEMTEEQSLDSGPQGSVRFVKLVGVQQAAAATEALLLLDDSAPNFLEDSLISRLTPDGLLKVKVGDYITQNMKVTRISQDYIELEFDGQTVKQYFYAYRNSE